MSIQAKESMAHLGLISDFSHLEVSFELKPPHCGLRKIINNTLDSLKNIHRGTNRDQPRPL